MSCGKCLNAHLAPHGLECRAHPKTPMSLIWTGAECGKGEAAATPEELADLRNYRQVAVYPWVEPDEHCGDFVHRV